jgi:hypothetical protein
VELFHLREFLQKETYTYHHCDSVSPISNLSTYWQVYDGISSSAKWRHSTQASQREAEVHPELLEKTTSIKE